MTKVEWKAGTMIYPLPAVMVSCGNNSSNYNIITISWTGTICTDPAMCYISVRPERHSYNLIKKSGGYVINLTTKKLAKATDWCGVKSGRDTNKFKELKLTPFPAKYVQAPLIAESPINIECEVSEIKKLGSHDMFISKVIAVHADEAYLDSETGAFDLAQVDPIAYSHGQYYLLGKKLGKFGYTVMKKKQRRKEAEKQKKKGRK